MDSYIAAKPVRFDRDYIIGEQIPDSVIDARSIKRLISTGRIVRITQPPYSAQLDAIDGESGEALPEHDGDLTFSIEQDTDETDRTDGADDTHDVSSTHDVSNTHDTDDTRDEKPAETSNPTAEPPPRNDRNEMAESSTAAEPPTDGTTQDLTCQICGMICKNRTGLIAHMKTHEAA